MATMKLWSDEIEALRGDARAAVAKGSDFFPIQSNDDADLSRDERIAKDRAAHDASTFAIEDAEEVDIAGVRCRVFRADGDARAIYLHFHGGGMVSGSPEMMDYPNQQLA